MQFPVFHLEGPQFHYSCVAMLELELDQSGLFQILKAAPLRISIKTPIRQIVFWQCHRSLLCRDAPMMNCDQQQRRPCSCPGRRMNVTDTNWPAQVMSGLSLVQFADVIRLDLDHFRRSKLEDAQLGLLYLYL
jgi:hypothetical protein